MLALVTMKTQTQIGFFIEVGPHKSLLLCHFHPEKCRKLNAFIAHFISHKSRFAVLRIASSSHNVKSSIKPRHHTAVVFSDGCYPKV